MKSKGLFFPDQTAQTTLRKINLLLIQETEMTSLLQTLCRILKEGRKYGEIRIAVLNSEKGIRHTAPTSLALKLLKGPGHFRPCLEKALDLKQSSLTLLDSRECQECEVAAHCRGWAAITSPLIFKNKLHGILFIILKKELVSVKTELSIVDELAYNIGAGLHRIRQTKLHRKTEKALKKRGLELDYFFSLAKLTQDQSISLEEIIQKAMDLIPHSMQHPSLACAETYLVDTNQRFRTRNFAETPFRIKNRITVNNKYTGTLTICYRSSGKEIQGPAFLKEEQALMRSVAARLGRIIERKRGRAALEESEKRFRDLTNHSVTGIALIQNGEVVFQNPEYLKIFGPLSGSASLFINDRIHTDDREKTCIFHQKLFKEPLQTLEILEPLDVDFRIHTDPPLEGGQNLKSIFCRATHTEYRSQKAVLLNVMDMTKPRELEQMLRIQDKMTSLGRIAAGMAHEIRNPLSGINIYLKSLENMIADTPEFHTEQSILAKIQSASNRIEAVIKRVMDFSKPGELTPVLLDLNQPVKNALDLASVTLRKKDIQVRSELGKNLPPCPADAPLIEQVILNLLTNAAEAMTQKGTKEKTILVATAHLEDSFLCIRVEDSGPGIAAHLRDKVFDPFFTTKNSSGIGLSICQRIITDHGGRLEVFQSRLGGAEFIIQLPLDPSCSLSDQLSA